MTPINKTNASLWHQEAKRIASVRLVAPSADLVMNHGRRVTGMNMYEPCLAFVAFCSSARYARARADRHRQTERQRQTETDRDRQTDIDRQTNGRTNRQTDSRPKALSPKLSNPKNPKH